MNNTNWILLDTETTGFSAPVFVVELAAQRMRGWETEGEPFRKLLNQNKDIPPEASRVHGYTGEILERDGEAPLSVYRAFAEYAGNLPLVSFNLEYDLEEVLKPEWKRLHVAPIGSPSFCALRLAQRLLDPVPAGNCKLQTLRQYYRLPEHGAHTALGDVQTVADLMAQVLRPIAEHRGLEAWDKLVAYAAEEWYPSRIAFGKHKGRLVGEARRDAELRRWLDWLAGSSNARSASMGRWYLEQLGLAAEPTLDSTVFATAEVGKPAAKRAGKVRKAGVVGLVIYVNPELEQMRQLVAGSRARLAVLESTYTREKSRVDAVQAVLFQRLRDHYQKRDRLRLVLDYRKKYLDALLRGGEEEAEQTEGNYERARTQADKDYEETAAAVANRKQLTAEEEVELNRLWKKLVKLYHPDRFAHEPDKLATYEKLTAAINRAKDSGDIAMSWNPSGGCGRVRITNFAGSASGNQACWTTSRRSASRRWTRKAPNWKHRPPGLPRRSRSCVASRRHGLPNSLSDLSLHDPTGRPATVYVGPPLVGAPQGIKRMPKTARRKRRPYIKEPHRHGPACHQRSGKSYGLRALRDGDCVWMAGFSLIHGSQSAKTCLAVAFGEGGSVASLMAPADRNVCRTLAETILKCGAGIPACLADAPHLPQHWPRECRLETAHGKHVSWPARAAAGKTAAVAE